MNYTEYQPAENIKDIVRNYWRFEVSNQDKINFPLNHETLPHPEVSIVFIKQPYFQGIRMQGPHTRKFEKTIFPNSTYFGIRLMPWITLDPAVLNKQEMLNTTTRCPQILSKKLESVNFDESTEPELLISLVEERLTLIFSEDIQVTQNNIVKYICLELSGGKPVGDTIAEIPLSKRVIQKMFKQVVGMSMRNYHSVIRQGRLWSDFVKTKKNRSDLLYKYGFYDQAHFINDFKKQMDQTHTDFEKKLSQINISIT
ncbi:helix-turn-helix domain-containing protein [Mangrovivirga cuniculi]|uniref:HTH araC/xylS-type domain-containing protein n=1 Tax=Mangrovivirga cuniculi TaxID=2715131 RepID=A0A4D7JN80_9BACT|nr:AraC family transcriptional regulator [Mangrovivirga cuniculi]QCK16117.1 hypothetical protein DCC35_15900 [Mangrovivirga cuniculi]